MTNKIVLVYVRTWHFNSHTREGVTYHSPLLLNVFRNFNSHTREGVTASIKYPTVAWGNFNSHTREGVTKQLVTRAHLHDISTHTPVRV